MNKSEPITKEEIDRLFDRFYKVDKSRNREKGNDGLSMSIVKNIAEKHGSSCQAEYLDGGMKFQVKIKSI